MAITAQWTPALDAILCEGYPTWSRGRMQAALNAASPDGRTHSWPAIVKRAAPLGLDRVEDARRPASPKPDPVAKQPEPIRSPVVSEPSYGYRATATAHRVGLITVEEDRDAHARLVARQDQAKALLRRNTDPAVVRLNTRLPMREVYRLVGVVRDEKRAGGRA